MVVALCSKEVILKSRWCPEFGAGWRHPPAQQGLEIRHCDHRGQASGKVEQKETREERDVLSLLLVQFQCVS